MSDIPASDGELYATLRAALQPKGTADLIRMDLGPCYLPTANVHEAIAVAEKMTRTAHLHIALGDEPIKPNALEMIGLLALMRSAGVKV